MDFKEAQHDMRYAYFGGAPGVFASGLVWLTAGVVALVASAQASILALFLGGIFIHPLGMLFSRFLKRPGKHRSDNPLGTLALETTFLLFIGLFLAFATAQINIAWFFPVMLLIIGGRYLTFSSIYGLRFYWLLGALLAVIGGLCLLFEVPAPVVTLVGGLVEIVCSLVILNIAKRLPSEAEALSNT